MTSLADELDLDPTFSALNLSGQQHGGGGGGIPLSLEQDDDADVTHSTTSSTMTSPARPSRYRRGQSHRRAGSSESDDVVKQGISRGNEGFSLADELGGGGNEAGASLADEVNGGLSIEEEHVRLQAEHVSSALQNDEARARRDQEHYLISSEILNDSARQTDAFLVQLRRIADTAATTTTTAGMPSRSSTTSITAASGGISQMDDTASIENTAAGIVRQLREHAHLREGQLRELQECDRILRRAFEEGGEYLMALAEIDGPEEEEEIEANEEDKDPLGIATAAATMIERRRHTRQDSMLSDGSAQRRADLDVIDETAVLATSPDHTQSDFDDTRIESVLSAEGGQQGDGAKTTKRSAFQELIKLQQSTSDLVVSLGVIHEHSQIAHASMGDAARRIRNIRTVLSNWQDEVKLMEQSQSWISAWESGQGRNAASLTTSNRPKDIRQWTQGEMDKFERILEEAHAKAQQLLMPIKDPVLDRLAASKA